MTDPQVLGQFFSDDYSWEKEAQFWHRIIQDLQDAGITLEKIAEETGVTTRQVSAWKTGERPKGLRALKLKSFHMEHRTPVHSAS